LFPATTGSGESLFVTARSATGVIVVPWVELLLAFEGSAVDEETVAVLEIPPPVPPAVVVIVMLGVAPAATVPSEQVTVPAAWEHDPCDGVAET
jgi:hypothetical protein